MKSTLVSLLVCVLSAGSLHALVFERNFEATKDGGSDSSPTIELASHILSPREGLSPFSASTASAVAVSHPGVNFPYRNHVGQVGMGSGIYLGSGYVLTSAHVGCYPFQAVDGSIYRPDYASWKIIAASDGSPTDLAVFRVKIPDTTSLLAGLLPPPIAKNAPKEDSPALLLGTGLEQKAEPATLKSGDKVLSVLGYHVDRKRRHSIGYNSVEKLLEDTIRSGAGRTHCFSTRFDRDSGDAQASDGDSGGACFVYNFDTGRWELAGCIIAVTQKGGFVPFGSQTFLADLSRYPDQLPEVDSEADRTGTFLVSNEPENARPDPAEGESSEPGPMGDEFMPM